jgi:hypothetical protein
MDQRRGDGDFFFLVRLENGAILDCVIKQKSRLGKAALLLAAGRGTASFRTE